MDQYQKGELPTISAVRAEAKASGLVLNAAQNEQLMNANDDTEVGKQHKLEQRMHSFSADEVMQVWKEMVPDERDAYKKFARQKIFGSKTMAPADKREALATISEN
jgi:hypothetical protein